MTSTYHFKINEDFKDGVNLEILNDEIEYAIKNKSFKSRIHGNKVDVTFDEPLSDKNEIKLMNVIASHTDRHSGKDERQMYTALGSNTLIYEGSSGSLNRVVGNQKSSIIISQDGQNDYSSIKHAIMENFRPNILFTVFPGNYIEDNPIYLPLGCTLISAGNAGNTSIIAKNPDKDVVIISSLCKIHGVTISNASNPGSRGIYFDGSKDKTGLFSLVEDSFIKNCDIGIEADGGPDSLVITRVFMFPGGPPPTMGIYAHNGASVISLFVMCVGLPAPYSIPMITGVRGEGKGTKLSLTTTTTDRCINGMILDDDVNVEATLTNLRNGVRGIIIGPKGEMIRMRINSMHITNNKQFDMDIIAKNADIEFFSSEVDMDSINNPNNVKINGKFYQFKNHAQYQTLTGDIRIGSSETPASISMGQGKYQNKNIHVLTNTYLEEGVWKDNTEAARSSKGSEFYVFNSNKTGACCYIGFPHNIYGVKASITAPTIEKLPISCLVWEYWDGLMWTSVNAMQTNADKPYHLYMDSFICSNVNHQIRLGTTSKTYMPEKNIMDYNQKWIRIRLLKDIPNIPRAEYFKVHTSHVKVNKDGFIEFFGNSRPVTKLDFSITDEHHEETGNSSMLYLSKSVCIIRDNYIFPPNKNKRICVVGYLDKSLDTSFPIKLKLAVIFDDDTPGKIVYNVRYGYSIECEKIYRNMEDVPIENDHPPKIQKNVIIHEVPENSKDIDTRIDTQLDVSNINVNPDGKHASLIWFCIERDTEDQLDDYPGSIYMIDFSVFGIKWNDGSHILSY